MPTTPVIHNTFVVQRNYPRSPDRVFAAFADPARKRRWFAEGPQHEVEHFELDFREGGREFLRSRFGPGTPFPGVALINEGVFQHIEPNRLIVVASTMTLGARRISATLVTIELLPGESGTALTLTHQGVFFEGADGPQIREAGWRELCSRLAAELDR